MEETPDREITFPRHTDPRDGRDNEFDDANETLDDPRSGACGRGSGDSNGIYRDGLNRRQGRGDVNQTTPYKLSIKPETYDGGDDWEEYISHFEICAELGRWTEHEKVLALGMALKGPARTFYISLTVTERQTYDVLVQRLGQRFGSTRQKNRWLSRLESRKRGQGESIAALADDLRQMAQRAYSDLDARAQEVLALNQLYKSVSPEIKYQCTNQECTSVTEAVEVIERYEAIIGDCTDRKRPNVRMVTETGIPKQTFNDDEGNTNMADTLHKLTRLVDTLDDKSLQTTRRYNRQNYGSSRNARKPLSCHFCGKTDHLIKNCIAYAKCKQEFHAKQQAQRTVRHNENRTNQTSDNGNQGNFNASLAH